MYTLFRLAMILSLSLIGLIGCTQADLQTLDRGRGEPTLKEQLAREDACDLKCKRLMWDNMQNTTQTTPMWR